MPLLQPKSLVLCRNLGSGVMTVSQATVEALSEGQVLCRLGVDTCVWRAMEDL